MFPNEYATNEAHSPLVEGGQRRVQPPPVDLIVADSLLTTPPSPHLHKGGKENVLLGSFSGIAAKRLVVCRGATSLAHLPPSRSVGPI
jgi:hypothetical protein